MRTLELAKHRNGTPHLGKTQREVLEAIRSLGKCHNRQIAKHLDWEINRVTGRVRELFEKEQICEAGTQKVLDTNRTVTLWQIIEA